jgi:uncharacterized protein
MSDPSMPEQSGNQPNSTAQSSLFDMTLRQLRRVASAVGVSRYSRMRKEQLLDAIQARQGQPAAVAETATETVIPETAPAADLPRVAETAAASNLAPEVPASAVLSGGVPIAAISAQMSQTTVEASKYDMGSQNLDMAQLATVDEGLGDLPGGYGVSRIMLLPRDPQWAYVYWDVPHEDRVRMRQMGGQQLALRLCDVTDINPAAQPPHNLVEYPCDETAREWYMAIPVSDREYLVEIGYRTFDGRWLMLARSPQVRVPPVYPSEWIEDHFLTLNWEADLVGKTFVNLISPAQRQAQEAGIHEQVYALAGDDMGQRVDGSLYGSMHHVAGSIPPGSGQMFEAAESLSSFVFPSGVGMWAGEMVANTSGLNVSGLSAAPVQMTTAAPVFVPNRSGLGMPTYMPNMSGLNVSGLNDFGARGEAGYAEFKPNFSGLNMSGVGMSSSDLAAPRKRQFWLVADAELIVYGATEPDAKVYIGDQEIQLSPDGTFRFQMSFQDGLIDYPIVAVASDGEQNRSVHMEFTRNTPARRTNTKAEAIPEWF